MWFCKNVGQQSIKRSYLHIGDLNCSQLSIVDLNGMVGSVFGGISYNVSTIFAKSHEKSHRLWTKNQSLARGLLALQIKIPLGNHFLGPWEGGMWSRFYFFVNLTSPPGQPSDHLGFFSHETLWGWQYFEGVKFVFGSKTKFQALDPLLFTRFIWVTPQFAESVSGSGG